MNKIPTAITFLLLVPSVFINCNQNRASNEAIMQNIPYDLKERNIIMPTIPRLDSVYWINGGPEILDRLKGKVIMVDFWDYTCVNCIRTLPYVKEWNRRYADKGLVILGVHTPEFEFGKKRENVERAVKDFGIPYPVVMDNDYKIWTVFGNRYWPAKYIFDKNGILRYEHFGEGNYGETEAIIQELLKEIDPSVQLPVVMEPVRPEDKPGAVCYRASPETYLGYERGNIGNPEGYKENEVIDYVAPTKQKDDVFYLVGRWRSHPQSVQFAGTNGESGSIRYTYSALEANLVIHPETKRDFTVYVEQDGKPVPQPNRGSDIMADSAGQTFLRIDEARMYNIIKNPKFEHHSLTLRISSNSFAAYAFTFTTACEQPTD